MRFFICTYTNRVKDYCDTEFLDRLAKISKGIHPVLIVDNTNDDGEYSSRLITLTHKYPNINVSWLMVPSHPQESKFQRNVCQSVNLCRDEFLMSGCSHMLIIESDVLPPEDLLDRLEESVLFLEGEDWGIVGGLYYKGFHDYSLRGINQTHHVLSGCSLYNRQLIVSTPFRYEPTALGAFPDAWMSVDATAKGFTLWNNHDILCEHLEISPGRRQTGDP